MILSHENSKVYIQKALGDERVEFDTQHYWLQTNLINMLRRIDDLLAANTELVLQNRKLRHSHLALVDLVEAKKLKEPIVVKASFNEYKFLENQNCETMGFILDRTDPKIISIHPMLSSIDIQKPKLDELDIAVEIFEKAYSSALNHPVKIEIIKDPK